MAVIVRTQQHPVHEWIIHGLEIGIPFPRWILYVCILLGVIIGTIAAKRFFQPGIVFELSKRPERLIMIPYEVHGDTIRPITVHAVTRQQINFRIKTGRFSNE